MNLFKTFIHLREKSHPDHEKPFLEHLEDLRTMIMRVVITLLISMIVCFLFNNRLMEFFRRPVDKVLVERTVESLPGAQESPRRLTPQLWNDALKVEHAMAGLTPGQRAAYIRSLADGDLVFHAESVALLRTAMSLPEDRRESFVASLNETPELKDQVKALLKTKPNTDNQHRGDLSMMSALKPTEGFMLSMKLSFVAGIVISFPLLLMYILQFVLPGLHNNEKRVLWPAMAVGFGLFLCGTLFAYFIVLPRTLLFFYQWSRDMGISNDWRIGEYISFATQFTLLFGVAFELPVVVMVMVKLGLLTYETMSKTRTYAVVAIFITAAILTPTPDIPTQCIMAAPMLILYEICIWLAWFDRRKHRRAEEQEAREQEERLLAQAPASDPDNEPPSPGSNGQEPDDSSANLPPQSAGSDQADVMDKTGVADEGDDDGWTPGYPQQEFHDPPELTDLPAAEEHDKPKHPDSGA